MAVDYLSALNSKGSGLNITQIVDSLVQAEKTPQSELINNKITKNNTSISAIAEVKSALSGLSSSVKNLKGSTALTPTSNSTSITVEINDASKATTLDSSITVSSLAAGQTLAFSGFSSSTAIVGGGTLKLERGDWSSGSFVASSTVSSQDVTVSSSDTLASLRDKINALNYGVTASIVGTGDGTFNLVLKSETGAENALRVTATESPSGSGLASIDNTSTNASKQKIAGVDASIVVDGITLTRSTNNITDLFEGYSVNLISTTSSAAKIVSSVDIDQAEKYLQTFVDAVNVIKKVFNEKTFRGSPSSKPGPLASDTVILGIKKRIDSFFSSGITGFGADSLYLSNLGVRTEKDNTLSLNSTILAKELENNPATYDAIFNSMYSSGSSLLSVSGGTNKPPKAGSYTFAMTAFVAGAVTGLNDIDSTPEITSSNNTIQLTVDGTTSGTITVPASHYSSQGALATAIQTAINNDSTLTSAGKSVIVSYENSSYTIKSSSKGSDTSMVINAIGSNLDGFLKMSGSTDTDNIGTSQSGTSNTELTFNGAGVTTTDTDGLVKEQTLGSSGNFSFDGTQAGGTLNSHVTISSSSNLSLVSFTITGTDINDTVITETITGATAGGSVTSSKIFKTVTQVSSNAAASSVDIGTKAAFVDITGERASITSLGSDESSISFTVVGTDMSGVTQTEVITGPSANSTAIGSKTFQTISSITPNSNTTGSISLGFSGVGITTTGVTGSATLNGISMIPDVTNNLFSMASGDGAGLKVQYSGLGANANVFYGESLIDMITNYVDDLLSSSNSTISDRLSRLNKDVASQNTLLSDLDTQFESIRSRYVQQFSAMEQAVTSLKSTGSYLENLFKAMNKED